MGLATLIARGIAPALALALAPTGAWAYIDPGTGSILLQGLIAAVAGVAVVGRIYWHRLKQLFTRERRSAPPDHPRPDDEQGE